MILEKYAVLSAEPALPTRVWDDTVEDLLESVPAELALRWRQRLDNENISTDEEAEQFVRGLMTQRERVRLPRFRSEKLRTLDRMPAGLLEKIKEVDRHAVELDRGHWGRIMRCKADEIELANGAPLGKRVLYKVLLGPVVGHHNDLESESGFLAELYTLTEKRPDFRVAAPAPYFFISDPRIDILAMEDISHAVSVKNIIENRMPIPETYPLGKAFDMLRQFISYMHEEGFYHRDLREGNIMLNLNATESDNEPLAYIIDTGFAIKTFSEAQAREGMDKTPDNGMINAVEKLLKTSLQNRETSI